MIKSLLNYISSFNINLSEEEQNVLNGILCNAKLRKKEILVEEGTVCTKIVFFNQGYFRFYHLDYKGNEITSDFYFGPSFIASYTSLITENPSKVYVQAMNDMDVLELSKNDLSKLYNLYPKFERLGRLIAESVAINSEEHLFLLLNQTAEVRYRKLLEKSPFYVKTIPLQYIASYLGITQETLSRIRKSIF